MFEEHGMKEVYDEINKYKDEKELLEVIEDINKVENMIYTYCNKGTFDGEEADKISNKYQEETAILRLLENALNLVVKYNYNNVYDVTLQSLRNLRHRLYRVAIMKILKLQGKDSNNQDVVSKDYIVLLELIKK